MFKFFLNRRLLSVAANGNLTDVEKLLASGADDRDGALRAAVDSGNTVIIHHLLKSSTSPNAFHKGWSVIHHAVEKANTHIVELLLRAGADVNAQSRRSEDKGFTPLHLACSASTESLVELLLTNGADPNADRTFDRRTPLYLAVLAENAPIVAKATAKGKDR